jgi:hypothetical protein
MSADGADFDTLGTFAVRTQFFGDGGYDVLRHFTPQGMLAAGSDRIYWSEGGAYEIEQHTPADGLLRVIRLLKNPVRATPTLIREFRTQFLAAEPDGFDEETIRRFFDEAEYAPELPAISDILVDPTGQVWVARYHYSFKQATEWDVFAPDGQWMGMVQTPESLNILNIGDDVIIGVMKDEMDVEYVRAYELVKPGLR